MLHLRSRNLIKAGCRLVRRYCEQGFGEKAYENASQATVTPILTSGDRSVNHVTLIGRIGAKPEVRGTPERPIAVLSLATTQTFRRSDGIFYNKTQWHRVTVFRPSFVQKLIPKINKGDKVYVSGKLEYGSYQSKEGETVKTANVIADNDLFVLSQSSKNSASPDEEDDQT